MGFPDIEAVREARHASDDDVNLPFVQMLPHAVLLPKAEGSYPFMTGVIIIMKPRIDVESPQTEEIRLPLKHSVLKCIFYTGSGQVHGESGCGHQSYYYQIYMQMIPWMTICIFIGSVVISISSSSKFPLPLLRLKCLPTPSPVEPPVE